MEYTVCFFLGLMIGIIPAMAFAKRHTVFPRTLQKINSYKFPTKSLKRYQFPTHINDMIMDRTEAQCSEVFMVIVPVNKGTPFHKHDDTEQIFYILEGQGTLTVNDDSQSFNVAPGDVVRIPMQTFHTIKADKGELLKYLCIDCFGSNRAKNEPTWDEHVKVLCKQNAWNYDTVVQPPSASGKP
jgi:mannose-6-phosphate isomerase-like protein (cupin superfamily)